MNGADFVVTLTIFLQTAFICYNVCMHSLPNWGRYYKYKNIMLETALLSKCKHKGCLTSKSDNAGLDPAVTPKLMDRALLIHEIYSILTI